MKQKILKLIKILNKFTIDEILSMDDFNEKEVIDILSDLEKSKVINRISENQYIYFPQNTTLISAKHLNTLKISKQINFDIKTLFSKEEEQEVYNNATPNAKSRIVKYYTILKIASHVNNNCVDTFIKQLSQEHPEYKISLSTFYRIRLKYTQYGIRGLIPNYSPGAQSSVTPEMYETFKSLYLKPKGPSVNECVKKIKEAYNTNSVPTSNAFRRLLNKEFSSEAVAQIRETVYHLPDLNFSKEDKLHITDISNNNFEDFIDGANEYLKYLTQLKQNRDIKIKITAVKIHLIPFFQNYTFSDITQDVIFSFQNKKILEGYSRKYLKLFSKELEIIINKYSISYKTNLKFKNPNKRKDFKILTNGEIKKIIKKYKQDLWILYLGITPFELYNLDFKDINYNNHTVTIKSINHTIYTHRHKENIDRQLYIPDVLFNTIPKHQHGRIFLKVNIPNYDTLINTHVYLSIKHNIPLNIISKNIGYTCFNDFLNRFDFLLSHDFIHKTDILDKCV